MVLTPELRLIKLLKDLRALGFIETAKDVQAAKELFQMMLHNTMSLNLPKIPIPKPPMQKR